MQQRVRVLIADEDPFFRSALRAKLEANSHIVICAEAADGREAVDLAIVFEPDVAVLDLSLSVLHGMDATRQIRRNSPRTQVLVLSDVDREHLISEALEAGAGAYLLKHEGEQL